MKKAAIPVVRTGKPDLDLALSAIKQNIDVLTGQSRAVEKLDPLPATATLQEVIARLNVLLARLQ